MLAGRPLVITHNGASGDFAPCTDLAYQKAVEDGADVIDCSVQLSKDGIAFCLNSLDLVDSTTAMTTFIGKATMILFFTQVILFSSCFEWSFIESWFAKKPQSVNTCRMLRISLQNKVWE